MEEIFLLRSEIIILTFLIRKNIMQDFSALKTTQTCFLPIYHYAVMIEHQYEDLLIPNKLGIYKAGEIEPCIVANKSYFSQSIDKISGCYQRKAIVDFNKETNTVTDEIGTTIISSTMMRDKEHYLSNIPTVPARGLLIIEMLIKRFIESVTPWSRNSSFSNKLVSQFKINGSEILNEGHLDKICESLYSQLSEFIGHDVWHIYFVKFSGVDIIIEKTLDFRIQQWEQEHGHEYNR